MKKTITTITLALVLTFGATFANAGIIVGDRASNGIIVGDKAAKPTTCANSTDNGIIVFGTSGIIVFGIIVFGSADTRSDAPCSAPAPTTDAPNDGIIVFG